MVFIPHSGVLSHGCLNLLPGAIHTTYKVAISMYRDES